MSPRRRPEIGNHHTRILIAAQARLLRVWNGIFAAGDWRAKRGLKTMSPRRDPEIGDYHTREMAAKTAFLLASYQLRVSEDCLVETRWIETECPPLSLSNESPVRARNGNFQCRD